MTAVALFLHHGRPQAVERARRAAAWLEERGRDVRLLPADADAADLSPLACALDSLVDGLELAVSLGGDGTMLRAVDAVGAAEVPVLGVNIGHLGYLTAVESDDLLTALDRFLAGDYEIEERMTLEVAPELAGAAAEAPLATIALNEAWLEKTVPGHTVRLAVTIGDCPWTTYAADGLIVSTPTGSTAYNLSVRGPIVSPHMAALVLTPVSPHMLFDLSLVLGPAEPVRIEVLDDVPASLLADGRPVATLHGGDAVTCRAGPHNARFVSFGRREFFRIVKTKFGLADR